MAADAFRRLLDATLQHLESLQAQGVHQVAVDPAELARLTEARPPMPRSSRPSAPARTRPAGANPTPRPVAPPTPARRDKGDAQTRRAALAELEGRALSCIRCPHLASSRSTVVFGVGNPDADLMFIGEAPGADEDRQGEPFVGKAGQLLTRIIETMGLTREQVYIANILKCRPDTPGQTAGNRKPSTEEMTTCIPHLHEQIDLIQPRALVALGSTAVEGLLGKCPPGQGITRMRGNWQEYRGIALMPTYHPAYLLRNQSLSEKRKVWEDMLQVMQYLGHPISAKQRGFFLKPA